MAEKRLIEIIECLEHCAENTDCERCSRWLYPCDAHCVDDLLATAAKELRKFMDAVPVVRCKDCKWYDPRADFCTFWDSTRHPEHYCGEGVVENE